MILDDIDVFAQLIKHSRPSCSVGIAKLSVIYLQASLQANL